MQINAVNIFKQVFLPIVLSVAVLVIGLSVMKGYMAEQTVESLGAQLAALQMPDQTPNAIAPASGE